MKFSFGSDKTVLILMPYYNRPVDVLRALESIEKQTYKNWKLAFIDDGSDLPGEEVVKKYFPENLWKNIYFYNTTDTKEIKKQRILDNSDIFGANDKNAGHWFVPFMNLAISEIKHDIAIFLCDDDFLKQDYLTKLVNFYDNHEDCKYSYCDILLYQIEESKFYISSEPNRFSFYKDVLPYFKLDGSQVSWTKECYEDGCKFSEDLHVYWDAEWFKVLSDKYGLCKYNKLMGQYKFFSKDSFYYQ